MNKKELLELIKLDSERYYNLSHDFHKDWLINNKCKCCEEELIKSGKCVIVCKEFKKALDKYTKDLRREWYGKVSLLCKINLSKMGSLYAEEVKK